jgi:SAM-dependent methyltransferase
MSSPREWADRAALRALEESYLAAADPWRGSGFHGGPERWRQEREPILEAITRDGHILDVGCANGLLLESLVQWAGERSIRLVPHGVDVGPGLVALARQRLPDFADNIHAGDIWRWVPPRRYEYVYSVIDCAEASRLAEYARLLLVRMVAAGGRLILGAYATRQSQAQDPAAMLGGALGIAGMCSVGGPARSRFVWLDAP